ncbi:hypothetical protein EDD17DRAFT_1870373 [Pisolithus thermaeus]|nr:hypothetical protein EDD17DRAFT_1870373 [Pisolithus thermaeus]
MPEPATPPNFGSRSKFLSPIPKMHVAPASTQNIYTRRRFPAIAWNSSLMSPHTSKSTWIALMSFLVILSLLHLVYPSRALAILAASATPNTYITQTQTVASQIIQRSHLILHQKTLLDTQHTPRNLYDYALWCNGGIVLSPLTSPHTYKSWVNRLLGGMGSVYTALEDDLQEAIAFRDVVHVTHIMVDHISVGLTNATESAPRKLLLWGMVDGKDNLVKYHFLRNSATGALHGLLTARTVLALSRGIPFIPLARFDYNIHATNHTQLFPILDSVAATGMDFGVVVLEILDNWGGELTCLYRKKAVRMAFTLFTTLPYTDTS